MAARVLFLASICFAGFTSFMGIGGAFSGLLVPIIFLLGIMGGMILWALETDKLKDQEEEEKKRQEKEEQKIENTRLKIERDRLKKKLEKAVLDKKIKQGKTFEETKLNYEKYLEEQAKEKCSEDLRAKDNRYCCKKCDYKWESRKRFGEPSICPSCRGDFIVKHYDTIEGKKELKEKCSNEFWFSQYLGGEETEN